MPPCLFNLEAEYSLEKEMATQTSILAWKIPWIEKPGRLEFMASPRVGHDLATKTTQKSSANS